jgi:hypothetical protein
MLQPSKIILIGFALFFFAADLSAQGFNVFNNRNHPHLNWQVAETAHFEIMYPSRISGIEAEAAAIAEESYRALSENMGVTFSNKIRIYLSDEDEIGNGFANPIGKGYTMIWVNLNDYSEHRTGWAKWLRHVIAHELAHIFHFKAVWSSTGLLQYAIAQPTPIFWAEGIAQYQTETWSSQRGDRWLRKAIFDSRPNFRDGQSIENPRLMYAVGHAQLRYFTETYGDSTLADMLSYRNRRLGLFEYHDFDEAFKEFVDGGYDAFYEEWRKHKNVYYNTLASTMERTDSLQAEPLDIPGQFYFDAAVSPGDSLIALTSLQSLRRPVRNLYIIKNDSTLKARNVAEGSINTDLSWSRDGKTLFYSRLVRGKHSSLLNDIFLLDVETRRETRLTHSKRARFPVQGPKDDEIAYIINEKGTGNLFVMNLETGEESRVTHYTGDVQLHWPLWIESQESWLYYRFDEDGNRNLILFNPDSGLKTTLDDGDLDNKKPVLSPNQNKIAYTSLRDEVPNVFMYDFEKGETKRVTNLFTGGEVFGWMAETDTLENQKLLIKASETKRRDELYWVNAEREWSYFPGLVPDSYASWRTKAPPNEIPVQILADESLILDRYRYSSFRNITHAATVGLPYFAGRNDWGLFATTNWTEPLGKHVISALGSVSFANPKERTYGAVNYLNNQFYPSVLFSVYSMPGNSRFYGNRFLIEELTGGEVSVNWPLDRFEGPYRSSNAGLRVRSVHINPISKSRFEDSIQIPQPVSGRQTDLELIWAVKKQRPWRDNNVHPLDGTGLRLGLLGADKILGSDVRFLRADVNAFTILPSIGLQRIFLQARFQQQWGSPFPQDYIGFSRYDNITIDVPDQLFLQLFQDADRVRGYREFVSGSRVLFGSVEYQMPFLPSLNTTVLGILSLGSTSIALFSDAGIVWDAVDAEGMTESVKRWGAGAEIKNELKLFGLGITHSVGIAQPAQELFSDAEYDLYYRVRAVVPF